MAIERRPSEADNQPQLQREQLTLDGNYRWFVYDYPEPGIRLACLEDLESGIIVSTPLVSTKTRTAAHLAWGGARQSRASGTPWEILHDMAMKGVNPDAKMDETFANYGHRSVGDMARRHIWTANTPLHLMLAMFNLGAVNSGQEKSTRFQPRFGRGVLHELKHYNSDIGQDAEIQQEYEELGVLAFQFFNKNRALTIEAFTNFYQPEDGNSRHRDALTARVLDTARAFLPFGLSSGMAYETSARDLGRIIGELKASPVELYNRFAQQLERLETPTLEEEEYLGIKAESPSLVRHTQPAQTANTNIYMLGQFVSMETDLLAKVPVNRTFKGRIEQEVVRISNKYTEGDRMVAQYLLSLWPGMDREKLLQWVHTRKDDLKAQMSQIIFRNHDNRRELPVLARTSRTSLVFTETIAEGRDWNRHRAWGRFVNLPLVFGQKMNHDKALQILGSGYVLCNYLTQVPAFNGLKETYEKDLNLYYAKLYTLVYKVASRYGEHVDFSFLFNVLPISHAVDLWMHGDPKSASYMPDLRVRRGGHINYRRSAQKAAELLSRSESYLSAIGSGITTDVNPASREEFFDRG